MNLYILILTMTAWDGGAGIDHIEGLLIDDCKRIGKVFVSSHKYTSYQCIKRYGGKDDKA